MFLWWTFFVDLSFTYLCVFTCHLWWDCILGEDFKLIFFIGCYGKYQLVTKHYHYIAPLHPIYHYPFLTLPSLGTLHFSSLTGLLTFGISHPLLFLIAGLHWLCYFWARSVNSNSSLTSTPLIWWLSCSYIILWSGWQSRSRQNNSCRMPMLYSIHNWSVPCCLMDNIAWVCIHFHTFLMEKN